MRTLIWSLTALLAVLWTGFIAMAHRLTAWILEAFNTGSLDQAAGAAAGLPLPGPTGWWSAWVDPELLASLQAAAVSFVHGLGTVMPSSATLMAWIGPLLWVGWALALVPLLAIAALLHWLVGRAGAQQAAVRPVSA